LARDELRDRIRSLLQVEPFHFEAAAEQVLGHVQLGERRCEGAARASAQDRRLREAASDAEVERAQERVEVVVVDVREHAVELALALTHAGKRDGLLALLSRVRDGGAQVRKAIEDLRHVDRIEKERET
jgi:hypothetical protein